MAARSSKTEADLDLLSTTAHNSTNTGPTTVASIALSMPPQDNTAAPWLERVMNFEIRDFPHQAEALCVRDAVHSSAVGTGYAQTHVFSAFWSAVVHESS